MKFVTQHIDKTKEALFVNLDMVVEIGYKMDYGTGHLTASMSFGTTSPVTDYPVVKIDLESDPIGEKLKAYIDGLYATGAYIRVGENQYVRKNALTWVYWNSGTNPVQGFTVNMLGGTKFTDVGEDGINAIVKYLTSFSEKEGWVKKSDSDFVNMNLVGVGILPDSVGRSPWVASVNFSDSIYNNEGTRKVIESNLFK